MTFYLPGSRRTKEDPEDTTSAGLSGGRFTDAETTMLGEILEWWTNRRALDDSREPLITMFGGVDVKGTCTTVGLTPEAVEWNRAIIPPALTGNYGATYLIQAFGIPESYVGEVYSLLGICHFYYDTDDGWMSRYATTSRAPSGTTSTEVRTAVDPDTDTRSILIIGVSGIDIDWTVNAIRLEL